MYSEDFLEQKAIVFDDSGSTKEKLFCTNAVEMNDYGFQITNDIRRFVLDLSTTLTDGMDENDSYTHSECVRIGSMNVLGSIATSNLQASNASDLLSQFGVFASVPYALLQNDIGEREEAMKRLGDVGMHKHPELEHVISLASLDVREKYPYANVDYLFCSAGITASIVESVWNRLHQWQENDFNSQVDRFRIEIEKHCSGQ